MTRKKIVPEELIKSLTELTSQHDSESLEDHLLNSLMRLLNAEEIRLTRDIYADSRHLIKQVGHTGDSQQSTETEMESCATCTQGLTSCIEFGMGYCLQTLVNDTTQLLIPIRSIGGQCATLCIIIRDVHYDDQKSIVGIVRIYENLNTIFHKSEIDTLTGLLNRKTFDKRLSEIIYRELESSSENNCSIRKWVNKDRRQEDQESHYWLGVIDIDHFKRINDGYGHLYGDEVLLLLAQLMRKNYRSHDLLFRYGGEEFVVVIEAASEKDVATVFERFRNMIASYNFPQVGKVTISIGLSRIDTGCIVSEAFGSADKALYYAKSNGRNQIHFYEQLIDEGKIKSEVRGGSDIEMF